MSDPVTIESWAKTYIESTSLRHKCSPPLPPANFSMGESQDLRPGRPVELQVTRDKPRNFKLGALSNPETRAALHHKFWHHELQAAELMCWALLRFPEAPDEFKKGLIGIFQDEVRHMGLYQDYIEGTGFSLTHFPVRDWFWERVPTCQTPLQFVALLGMGLEGANLEHTERFENWFRTLGDEKAAAIQRQVGLEEIGHVRFAILWFQRWAGNIEFETWCRALPAPLTPLLLRGKTINRARRLKARFPAPFIEELARWKPAESPRPQSVRREPHVE